MEEAPVQITGAEENTVYSLTPTVVIGLGKVGSEAVSWLRDQLKDLDEHLLHIIKGITVSADSSVGQDDCKQSSSVLDAVKHYNLWDDSTPDVENLNRQSCFTKFVQDADGFKKLLGETVRELRDGRQEAVEAGLRLNEGYRFVVVGSLADDVSSALASEVPYFVQSIGRELGLGRLSSDELLALYTLEEPDIESETGYPNSYAALKELDHFVKEVEYTRLDLQDIPFKWCFLINPNVGGSVVKDSTELAQLMATTLAALLLSRLPEYFDRHWDDSLPPLGAIGLSFLSLPLSSIKKFAAKKQAGSVVDFLTTQSVEWNFDGVESQEIADKASDCLPKRDAMERQIKTIKNEQGEEQILDFSLSWEDYDEGPPFSELIPKLNALKEDYQERQREEFLMKIEQNSADIVGSVLDKIKAQVDLYIRNEPVGIAKAFAFLKQIYESAQSQKENVRRFLSPEVDIRSSRSSLEESLSKYSTRLAVRTKMSLPAIFLALFAYNCFSVHLPQFAWLSLFSGAFFLIIAIWASELVYGRIKNRVKLAKESYISDLREIARTEINANVQSRINVAFEQIQAGIGDVKSIMFSIGPEFQKDIENGDSSEQLRQQFGNRGIELPQNFTIQVEAEHDKWAISDEDGSILYVIKKEDGSLRICVTTNTTLVGEVLAFRDELKKLHQQVEQIKVCYQPTENEICLVDMEDEESVGTFVDQYGKNEDMPELLAQFLQPERNPLKGWQDPTDEYLGNLFNDLLCFLNEYNICIEEVTIEDFIDQSATMSPDDFESKVINAKDKSAVPINFTKELAPEKSLEFSSVISHSGLPKLLSMHNDTLAGFDALRCWDKSRIYLCQALLHLPLLAIDGFSSEANYYKKAYENICDKASLHTVDDWESFEEIG